MQKSDTLKETHYQRLLQIHQKKKAGITGMKYCPGTGGGDLEMAWTDKPHPAAEKPQCLSPSGKSERGKNQLLRSFTATIVVSDLAWLQSQTQLCCKDLLFNIGAQPARAFFSVSFLVLRIKYASPSSKCWLPSKPEGPLHENIV